MVTPSLVIVGAPKFLLMTTLRPRGPRVTLTASASLSTPRSRARRASSSNRMILAIARPLSGGVRRADDDRPGTRCLGSPGRSGDVLERRGCRDPRRAERVVGGSRVLLLLLLHDGEQVARGQDEEVLAA